MLTSFRAIAVIFALFMVPTWTTDAIALTCSAGYRVNSTGKSCEICPSGQYQDTSNTTKSCKACPSYSASNYHVYGGDGTYAKPWTRSTDADSAGIPNSISRCFIYFTNFGSNGDSLAWIYSPNTHHGYFRHYSAGSGYNGVCWWDSSKSSYVNCEGPKNVMEGCMPGYYINSSSSAGAYFTNACTICPAGTYQGYTNSIAVGNAGTMYYHFSNSCTKCAAGTYSSATGATSSSTCKNCTGKNKYSSAGASSCSPVTTGYYTTGCNERNDNCTGQTKCQVGYYCTGGVKTQCPVGFRDNTATGVSALTSCQAKVAAGKKLVTTAACDSNNGNPSAQKYCDTGTYSTAQTVNHPNVCLNAGYEITSCTTCKNKPANSYYTSYGKSSDCPWDCNSAVKGSGAYSATVTKGTSSCTYSGTCNANYYKPTASGTTVSCSPCPTGSHTSAGNAATSCTPNTYTVKYNLNASSYYGTPPGNTTCTYGTSCPLNAGTGTSFYRPGYMLKGWSTSSTATSGSFSVSNLTSTDGGSVTVYAVWSACPVGSYKASGVAPATNCTACQGSTTTGTASTSCNAACSNATGVATWVTASFSGGYVYNSCIINTCSAGYYKDGSKCTACENGYYCTGGTAARAACRDLTGASPTDGTYTSVSPRSANTNCRYTAPSKTITGCASVTSNTVSYSGSSWPASTYSVTANAGYYITNNNTSSASCSQCTGATYCTGGVQHSCPTATSGWTRGTGTGWTSYTSCYQTRAATTASSYCASGTLKQNATSASAWGATTVSVALSANAGAYVDGTTCSQCALGYYCTGGTAAPAACSNSLQYQDETGQSQCKNVENGYYKYSNSAQVQCPAGYRNGAAASSQSGCKAWCNAGTHVATANAACTSVDAGYYAAGHNVNYGSKSSQTICPAGSYCPAGAAAPHACTVGSYTSQPGQTACVACGDGADWGKTTTAVGQTGCNADCSNNSGVQGWANATWNSNNTVTDLCVPNSCLSAHYMDTSSKTCPRCDSFANAEYPESAADGTTGGREACFARRHEHNGYYIANAYDDYWTPCPAGTFSHYDDNGLLSSVVHYGETYKCSTCADDTYSTGSAAECTACPENYTTYGEKTSVQACHITCRGGTYLVNAGDGECAIVGAGYWAPLARVPYGSVGVRNKCDTGTTIGYGPGADEIDDCGPILHVGDARLYLRSVQKTHPALAFGINGITYYANMSTELKKMSDNIDSMLKIKMGDTIYTAYDDSGEFYVGPITPGITISPNLAATTIVPANVNASVGVTQWSATLSDDTTVAGTAICSATTATNGDVSADGFQPENSGTGCWCKITAPATGTRWVYASSLGDTCSDKCAFICANNMRGTSDKNITYRSHLYGTAGIATE